MLAIAVIRVIVDFFNKKIENSETIVVRKIISNINSSLVKKNESKSEARPSISKRLYIFEPIILPIIRLILFFFAAAIQVAISGSDVPIAITVSPIKESEIPS